MIVRIRKSAYGRSMMASENDQPDQATCMERLRHEAMEGRALMEAYFAVGDAARLGASRQSSKAGGASRRNRSGETGRVRRGDYRASNVLSGDDED
jgi:transposase